MDRAVAIANEFLRKPGGQSLTQMQLQKLVYMAHGWTLALTGEPLTIEEPEAWDYGPVYSDLYDHTKLFGRSAIGREITSDDDEAARFFARERGSATPYVANLTTEQRQIIDQVWARYGNLSGARLSSLTHQPGTPWSQTYDGARGRVIKNEAIQAHYCDIAQRAQAAS
jgi:uncharacterized phage-associated protein